MKPFRLVGMADGRSPLLLASPHSGRWLPPQFLARSQLGPAALRRLEDAHVGALLHESTALGVPLIEATHARAVLDLNRGEAEHDPDMIDGRLGPVPAISHRVRQGYGLFPRIAGSGQPIHVARIPAETARAHVATLHRPWHRAIGSALAAAQARHGHAILLDVHSMPTPGGLRPPQLVLGDRHGRSAAPQLSDWLDQRFTAAGLRVGRNVPYAGGYTTEHHAAPAAGIHVVQLEFDRGLYMNPQSLVPHNGFAALSRMIAAVVGELLAALPPGLLAGAPAMAAE